MGALSVFGFLGSVFLFFYFLFIGKSLLIPLVLGFFLWYLVEATGRTLYKNLPLHFQNRWTKILTGILGMGAIVGMIVFIVYGIQNNLSEIIAASPAYQTKLQSVLGNIFAMLPGDAPITTEEIMSHIKLPELFKAVAANMTAIVQTLFMIVLFALFMSMEKNTVKAKLQALFPKPKNRERADKVLKNLDHKIRIFFTVKTFVSLSTGLLSYLVMKSIGLDFASFWAVMIFFLNYIPTFGSIIGTFLPTLMALIQFESMTPVLGILIGIGTLQVLIGNILEPRVMGRSLNLSPFVMIVSLMVWGALWGVIGMFVCVPLMVMLMLILSEFESTRPIAILMSQDGKLD
ncbi:MAG: AI-2E family transporter [Alphaproteobacteria bacterium]|nr:AI-2E family transporter [Alphaproteobacteria bacterium]